MGHRANFVAIKDGKATAYYDQWAAAGCTYMVAEGLNAASQALLDYEKTEGLMDWTSAEAGYLIDHDNMTAIIFGVPHVYDDFFDEDEAEGLPEEDPNILKLLEEDYLGFLEGIASGWKGWKIIWDDRGVDAFAEYLKERQIEGITNEAPSYPPETKPPVSHQA